MKVTEIAALTEPKKTLRLAPYCRVSSESEDQRHSFATQIRYYTDYVKKHPEFELVDIYADEGLTGTSMAKRDEFNRLIRDCKKGLIDRVITKSVARFARNTQDLLTVLRLLKELGVSVYFEEQGIDTTKMNMEMIVTFPGLTAQQESESISANMKWSYKKRMESGDFNCCYAAYGYNLKDGEITVNEPEAEVVRRIFAMYLQGIGKQSIATILNRDNVPRREGQKAWYNTTILYILNNERYIGDSLLQKTYMSPLPYKKMKNHGEVMQYYVENSHPPIISRETFKAVQDLQAQRKVVSRAKNETNPLSGKVRCGDCGHTFRRQIINGIAYWVCSYKTMGNSDCSTGRIPETEVYEAFTLMVHKLTANRIQLLGTLIRQTELLQSKASGTQAAVYQIDKEIADYCAKNLVITRLHTKGVLGTAEYTKQNNEINQKINSLRIERRKKLSEDEECGFLNTVKELNDILAEYQCTSKFDETLFEQIIERITVVGQSELRFKLLGGITLTERIHRTGGRKIV